jgi:hypothetical protein
MDSCDRFLAQLINDTAFHIRRMACRITTSLFLKLRVVPTLKSDGFAHLVSDVSVNDPEFQAVHAVCAWMAAQGEWNLVCNDQGIMVGFQKWYHRLCTIRYRRLENALVKRNLTLREDSGICRKYVRIESPPLSSIIRHVQNTTQLFKTRYQNEQHTPALSRPPSPSTSSSTQVQPSMSPKEPHQ